MSRRIDAVESALRKVGLKAEAWCKHGKHRVYVNDLGGDLSAFFDWADGVDAHALVTDDDDLLEGSCLRVWTDAGQTAKWQANRRKKITHKIMLKCRDAALVDEVCVHWEDVVLPRWST